MLPYCRKIKKKTCRSTHPVFIASISMLYYHFRRHEMGSTESRNSVFGLACFNSSLTNFSETKYGAQTTKLDLPVPVRRRYINHRNLEPIRTTVNVTKMVCFMYVCTHATPTFPPRFPPKKNLLRHRKRLLFCLSLGETQNMTAERW